MRHVLNGLWLAAFAFATPHAKAATASPDGTISPPAAEIIDSSNNVWTLAKGQALENGQVTPSSSVVELVYEKGVVYQENTRSQWFSFRNGSWVFDVDPLKPSPSGTGISPSIASSELNYPQIIDLALNSWTLVKGQAIEDGKPTASSSVILVYFAGGVIYQENAQNNWYAWRNGIWVATANPTSLSPNGATIPSAPLINTSGQSPLAVNTWTLVKGVAFENGQPTASSSVIELLFLGGVIYQENIYKNWYAWRNGSAWVATAPPIVASANGTAIPGTTQIVDDELNIWTLSGGRALENQAPTPSSSVIRLLFSNNIVYQENVHNNWYLWNGLTWITSPPPPGATPQQYALIDLGTLGGTSSSASAINAGGEVTGGSTLPGDQVTHAFIYANGAMKDIGTPDGGTYAAGEGINASGQLSVSTQVGSPWLYSSGNWTELNPADSPDDFEDFAGGINDSGHIVGETDSNGFFYNGTLHFFPAAIENVGFGRGSNNSDLITGTVTTEPGMIAAGFVYNPKTGSVTYIDAFNGGNESAGIAINSSGYTTGNAAYGNTPIDPQASLTGPPHAFLNDAQGLHDLGTLGGSTSMGNGINANSEVVGSSYLAGDKVMHAFLYTAGAMVDLNQLVSSSPLAPFVTLTSAAGINDSAWIIANGVDSRTGNTHGYLLQPTTAKP
ncbi:MAG TPA: hypothetical protein VGI93_20875 [Steroidobacteraceae bacterium]|jgi:probable HAF family extracellular repeat protein